MSDQQSIPSETRWRDLRTGILFVVGIALTGTLGLIIGKNTGLLTRHDTAHIFLEDIKGLTEGNMVTISGKKVGTVATMRFESRQDTEGIRIDLDIHDEYFQLINEDSRVTIKSLGVLGDKYVDIQLGRSTKLLKKDGWLSAVNAPGMEELTASALETMGHISDISARVSRGEGTVGKLIESDELARELMSTAHNIETITARLRQGEGLAGKILTDEGLARTTESIASDIRQIVTGLKSGKGTLGKMLMDSVLYVDLRNTIASTDSLLTDVGSPAGSTGRLLHDPQVYEQVVHTLNALDSLLVDLKTHPERYVKVSVF